MAVTIPSPVWVDVLSTDSLNSDLTDLAQNIRDEVLPPLETISEYLNIAQQVLDFASSFLIEFANPIKLLLNQIIATLQGLQADFRNMGFYLTYSEAFRKPFHFSNFIGNGWADAEAELVGKLNDRTDPSRPVAGATTSVLTLTAFGGVDSSLVLNCIKLYRAIRDFLGLFDSNDISPYLPPVLKEVVPTRLLNLAGNETAIQGSTFEELPLSSSSLERLPTGLRVVWEQTNLDKYDSPRNIRQSISIPPPGFLICISTRAQPLPLLYRGDQSLFDTRYLPLLDLKERQVLTPEGRVEEVTEYLKETSVFYYNAFSGSETGATPLTFFTGRSFSLDLKYDELPEITGEDKSYYVWVMSHNQDVSSLHQQEVTPEDISSGKIRLKIVGSGAVGRSVQLSIPQYSNGLTHKKIERPQVKYIRALRESVFRYVFSSDSFTLADDVKARIDGELGSDKKALTQPKTFNPESYRSSLKGEIDDLVDFCLQGRGIPNLTPALKDAIDKILDDRTTYVLTDVLEYDEDEIEQKGVAIYPDATEGISEGTNERSGSPSVGAQFLSTYISQVLASSQSSVALLLNASFVKRSEEGKWHFARVGDRLSVFTDFFETMVDFAIALRNGFDSAVDNLLALIALMKKRIAAIQSFIQLIREIIERILAYRLPADLSYLITSSAGTAGFAFDLGSAQNKPTSVPKNTFGVYASIVFVGGPKILTDFLFTLVKSDKQEGVNKWLTGYDEEGNPVVGIGNESIQ